MIQIKVDKISEFGKDTHLKIEVIDSGAGIDESDRSKLFKMFGMIDTSISKMTNTKGIGIGLSLSKQIVKKFNGIIDFTSEVGIGSNFYFTFELNEILDEKFGDDYLDYWLEGEN